LTYFSKLGIIISEVVLSKFVTQEGRNMLKSTGIVRKVDELGRVVIPIELRRTLNIAERDALEIYVDGEQIVLKKYEPACIFCGNAENVINYKGKNICKNCLEELKKTPIE
jgi:transcriptional pleiotropic regulator of transition state genes